jgi:hypothetical protein
MKRKARRPKGVRVPRLTPPDKRGCVGGVYSAKLLFEFLVLVDGRPGVKSTLTRPRNRMPAGVWTALVEHDLLGAYRARPPYQRNDYLGWIARAKRPETRAKRLGIMLRELKAGSGYMTLPYHAR